MNNEIQDFYSTHTIIQYDLGYAGKTNDICTVCGLREPYTTQRKCSNKWGWYYDPANLTTHHNVIYAAQSESVLGRSGVSVSVPTFRVTALF